MLSRRTTLCSGLLATLVVTPAAAQDDVFSLEGLVVTAAPTPQEWDAVAVNATVIDAQRLVAEGLVTVADALRSEAGLNVLRNGSFGAATSLFMRGGESDYVLVLVDGVQVNQPGGAYDLAGLTLANLERIEVVRGPASALYGSDAVAGVIHLITKTGRGAWSGRVSTRHGSFGRSDWSIDVSGGSERSGYSVSLGRQATDGILAFNNGALNTTAAGTARFAPDARTRVDVSFRTVDREFRFPTDGAGNAVDHNAFTFTDETLLGLRLGRALTDRVDLEARLGVVDSDGGFDDQPDDAADTLGFFGFTSLNDVRRASADVRANLRSGAGMLSIGWELEQQRQRSFTESVSEFGVSADRSENERLNRAYYAHWSGRHGSLAYDLGGRVEDNDRFGTFETWRLGVAWSVPGAPGIRLRGAAGRSLKEPTFFETFATGFARGNPDLVPERSRAWEVGADASLAGGAFRLRGTFFDQAFHDLIQFTFAPPSPADPNYHNIAEAESRGVELEARVQGERARVGATWTWLSTVVTDSGFDEGPGANFVEGQSLLRRPRHSVNLNASVRVGDMLDLFTDASLVGAREDRDFSSFPAQPVQLERYANVSVGAGWDVEVAGASAIRLTVRVENLLGSSYEEARGFTAPGRGIYLGGSVGFGDR